MEHQSILTSQGLSKFIHLLESNKKQQLRKYQEQLKTISIEYIVNNIIQPLTNTFINYQSIYSATLLINFLSSHQHYQNYQHTHLPIPIPTTQAVIALPNYQQSIWNTKPQDNKPIIVTHNDITSIKNYNQYFKEDEAMLPSYLQSHFTCIHRNDISETFFSMSKIVCEKINGKISERYNAQNEGNNHCLEYLSKLIEVMEVISPSIYTYHLVSMMQLIGEDILNAYRHVPNNIFYASFKKQYYQETTYTMNNLSDRWKLISTKFNIQQWDWDIKQVVIDRLIDSDISQQQLYGVKLLCDICSRIDISKYQQMVTFINTKNILQRIYHPSNHPQIITKGKQVFQFIAKYNQLTSQQLQILLNLLDKSHQQVCKSIYETIQSIGQKNLTINRHIILNRIINLSRPSFFYEQTFNLIETIILVAPLQQIELSLEKLYFIMQKHYLKFKKNIKQRIINIYFELFVIAVEQGIYENKEGQIIVMKPMLKCLGTQLAFVMIDSLVVLLQRQKTKNIEQLCNKILIKTIRVLFEDYNIHKIHLEGKRDNSLKLIQHLLQTYCSHILQNEKMVVSYEDICELMEEDISFSKFVQYYQTDKQLQVMKKLLRNYNINMDIELKEVDEKNIYNHLIEVYQLVAADVKHQFIPQIQNAFVSCNHPLRKQTLGKVYFQITNLSLHDIAQQIYKSHSNQLTLWSYLILLNNYIKHSDKDGYGENIPFKYYGNEREIKVKVTNCLDVLVPIETQLDISSSKTVKQLIYIILKNINKNLVQLKIKIANNFLTLDDFEEKVSDLNKDNQLNIEIYQSSGCEWFNKCQLITNKKLNSNVVSALREIFTKYAENGKLRRQHCASIFQIVTETDKIQPTDSRISVIFTKHSQNNEYLTVNEWIDFYLQSSIMNPGLVVENLKKMGYAKLFKQPDFMNIERQWQNQCRKQLININLSQFLLSLNSNQDVTKIIIELLNLLPINQSILNQVISLSYKLNDNIKQKWYVAQIIHSQIVSPKNKLQQGHQVWIDKLYNSNLYNQLVNISLLLIRKNYLEAYELQLVERMLSMERQRLKDMSNLLEVDPNDLNLAFKSEQVIRYSIKLNQQQLQQSISKLSVEIVQCLMCIIIKNKSINVQSFNPIIPNKQLIFHHNSQIRKLFNNFYMMMSVYQSQIKHWYYKIECEQNCEEYFKNIVVFFSEEVDDQVLRHYSTQIQQLLVSQVQTTKKIINNLNKVNKLKNNHNIMLGRLNILNVIKLYNPQLQISPKIIESIEKQCVSEKEREVFYSLTNKLCSVEYNLSEIERMVNDIHIYKNSVRREAPYMGLYNLGCTCYINASVQQLFMIQPFRKTILQAMVKQQSQQVINKNSYFQPFQYLFYQLAYGERVFFIPDKFCQNYIDSNNQPVNIKQQHDADEFINNLLDRIETTLTTQSLQCSNITDIKTNLCGSMSNTIQCQSCFNTKVRYQDFYILSLEIKGFKVLQQCLCKLIQPEVICDYYCDQCDKKVEQIHKYHTFNALPRYLFIHFQRLVFDLESFTKIKLDHPIEFPQMIDLQPYFTDKNKQEMYSLKGFIVHDGNSQSGHYYSLIKEEIEGQKYWMKFNDSQVEKWNWDYGSKDKEGAYILIYQKMEGYRKNQYESLTLSNTMMEMVKKDNEILWNQTLLLHSCLPEFIENTIKRIEIPTILLSQSPNNISIPYHSQHQQIDQTLKLKLYRGCLIIIRYINLVRQIKQSGLPYNINKVNNHQKYTKYLGENVKRLTCYFIFFIHFIPFRAEELFHQLIHNYQLITTLATNSQPILRELFSILTSNKIPLVTSYSLFEAPITTLLKKALLQISTAIDTIAQHYTKMDHFFQLIYCMCIMSKQVQQWMVLNHLPSKLAHLVMQSQSTLKKYYKTSVISSNKKVQSFNTILSIIQLLIHHQSFIRQEQINQLAFSNIQFYSRLHKERYNYVYLNQILCYYAKNNQSLTKCISKYVLSSLNRFNHNDSYIICYLHLIQYFITIDDDYQQDKLMMILGIPIIQLTQANDVQIRYRCLQERQGDEYYLPLLQLLYLNRKQLTYFQLIGVVSLLRCIFTNNSIYNYVLKLPSITNHPQFNQVIKISLLTNIGYLSWVGMFLQYALNGGQEIIPTISQKVNKKPRISLPDIDQHYIINQIANLITQIQNIQQNLQQQVNKTRSIISNYYHSKLQLLKSPLSQLLLDKTLENVKINYQIVYHVSDEIKNTNIPLYLTYIIESQNDISIKITQPNYQYKRVYQQGTNQFTIPYHDNFNNYIQILVINERPKKQNKKQYNPQVMKTQQERIHQDINKILDDIKTKIDTDNFNEEQQVKNNKKQTNQYLKNTTYECPFCGSISESFSSRCGQCGEQWGQMY